MKYESMKDKRRLILAAEKEAYLLKMKISRIELESHE